MTVFHNLSDQTLLQLPSCACAHLPGWVELPPLGCGGAVAEEVRGRQSTGSDTGQHHRLVTARHHTSEGACHGLDDYLVVCFKGGFLKSRYRHPHRIQPL